MSFDGCVQDFLKIKLCEKKSRSGRGASRYFRNFEEFMKLPDRPSESQLRNLHKIQTQASEEIISDQPMKYRVNLSPSEREFGLEIMASNYVQLELKYGEFMAASLLESVKQIVEGRDQISKSVILAHKFHFNTCRTLNCV